MWAGGEESGLQLIEPLRADGSVVLMLTGVTAERQRRLAPFERLTSTEQAVLAALVEGRTAEAIAADRYVSIATVRSQIRSILRQLRVNSQLEAVAAARHAGWSGPEPKA